MPPDDDGTNLVDALRASDADSLEQAVNTDFTDDDLEKSKNKRKFDTHLTRMAICIRWFFTIVMCLVALAFVAMGFKYLWLIFEDPTKLESFVSKSVSVVLLSAATIFVDRNFLKKNN